MDKQKQKKIEKVLAVIIIIIGIIFYLGIMFSIIILPIIIAYNSSSNVADATVNLENQMIKTFNVQIESYLGEGQSGSKVIALINGVITNINMNENEKKIKIILDNEEIEDATKIVRSEKYTIMSEKDSEGYINKVILKTENSAIDNLQTGDEQKAEEGNLLEDEELYEDNSQIDIENEMEKENVVNDGESSLENVFTQLENQAIQAFNMQVEKYLGEGKDGFIVNSLLHTIFKINNVEPERQIMIATDDEEIQNQSNVTQFNKYTITCEKDSEGYINKIIILKE